MTFSDQYLQEMHNLQRRNQFLTLEILPRLLNMSINSSSTGMVLTHGEISVISMSMMSEKHQIVMNVDIWKRKIKGSETNI